MDNLRQLDLNLLLTLDALLTEQNVTRAAQRLHLSQPSVSVQLSKLRDVFNDPLLLPGPRGMLPTARALQLREPLRQALDYLQQVIVPELPFDPALASRTWRVAATDYTESSIVLPALQGLQVASPQSRLAVLDMVPASIARQLEQGDIDLALHTRHDAPEHLHQRVLFSEHYVLVGREGHPQLSAKLSVQQFCQLQFVLVSPDGGGFYGVADTILAGMGLSRRVALSVPHFLFALSVLRSSDLVAMLPSRLLQQQTGLCVVPAPVQLPGFEMSMLWHERVHRDPAHQWLRQHVVASLAV